MARVPVSVRRARPADRAGATAVLAAAFTTDPVMSWLVGPDRNLQRRLGHLFAHSLRAELARADHLVDIVESGHAIAVWHEVDEWKIPPIRALKMLPTGVRTFGRRLPVAMRAMSEIEQHHPTEPHRYLEFIAVDPDHQGEGCGGALLASMTAECDERGVAAYLESSNPRNEPLYARYGFEPRPTIVLSGGGPAVTPMWRPAR